MIFGKYHLVIFKEGRSGSSNLHIGGWTIVLGSLFILALAVCNIWLWQKWIESRNLETDLVNAERRIHEQKQQTMSLAEKITAFSHDLERIQRFDFKLRLMMNMEKEPAEVGQSAGDFSRTYLPLHRQELAVRKMQDFLDQLGEAARLEEVRQQDLLRALRDNKGIVSSMPSIWPINGFITSSFGARKSPFGGGSQFHKGLDISGRQGAPIIASGEGTVTLAAADGAYGNSVEIDHGGGIVTKYAHLQRSIVKPGQWIRKGEVLGYVGMTGRATGPHLHYEVRLNGVPVNPMRYILE